MSGGSTAAPSPVSGPLLPAEPAGRRQTAVLHRKLGMAGVVFLAALHSAFACWINWNAPSNHFNGVNEMGEFSYWGDLGQLDLGGDMDIPLVIGFNPNRGGNSWLGRGFIIPVLESNLVQIDERKFLLTQPEGTIRQFWRKTATDTVLVGQGNWAGEIKGSVTTLWASCGWKLSFRNGKLSSFSTPEGRTFNIYSVHGRPMKLLENGRTLLEVNGNPATGILDSLSFGGHRVKIEMGNKPSVRVIGGTNTLGVPQMALHAVRFPDGKQTTYDFGVDDQKRPTLKISGRPERSFTWDPATGILARDGEWSYDIKPNRTDRWANAQIGRTNPAKQREFWYLDNEHGTEMETTKEGITKTTYRFVTGSMRGRVRMVTQTENGKTRPIRRYAYDEQGREIRFVDELGVIRIKEYSEGNPTPKESYALDDDPVLVAYRTGQEKEIMNKIATTSDPDKRDWARLQLASLYMLLKDEKKMYAAAERIQIRLNKYFAEEIFASYCSKSLQEKLDRYQELLLKYPEQAESINQFINSTKENIKKYGAQKEIN